MNGLDLIRAFAASQLPVNALADSAPAEPGEADLAALQFLLQNNDWVADRPLAERVISRLEARQPQSTEERIKTAAVYMKIVNQSDLSLIVPLNTVQIKISDNKTVNIPAKLLTSESRVFEELINENCGNPIDLSADADEETLTRFVDYLTTGNTDCVLRKNAIKLLLLAKKFELQELTMKSFVVALNMGVSEAINKSTMSEEEIELRQLLAEANECYISANKFGLGAPTIVMRVTNFKREWDCLKRLHDLVPITKLKTTDLKNPVYLMDFAAFNPDLVALDLDICKPFTDEHFSALAPYLTKLKSFSASAAAFTSIPKSISDRLTSLNCTNLEGLTSINAPNAKNIECFSCDALTSIHAPQAKRLFCLGSESLTELVVRNTEILNCNRSSALQGIEAPEATTIDCSSCNSLKEIIAPKAIKLQCRSSAALESICAPKLKVLDCHGCPALPVEDKLKLFNIVLANTIKDNLSRPDSMIKKLSKLFKAAGGKYGLTDFKDSPLNQWFIDSLGHSVPANFDSDSDSIQCEEEVQDRLNRLIAIATDDEIFQGCDFSWFMTLKKLSNPRLRMNQIIWLGCLLACAARNDTPLSDPDAASSLAAIGNCPDHFIQAGATRSMFSFYEEDASAHKRFWKELSTNRPDHLLLPCLFLASANIQADIAKEILADLEARYYRNKKLLNPIIEMVYILTQDPSLSSSDRQRLLGLILKSPQKSDRESAKIHKKRIEKYRSEQTSWVTACRDLMLFKRGHELKDVQTTADLLSTHKNICRSIFGVQEELLHQFSDTFKSKRYPNGLFTYAARLQTLPEKERCALTELLGKFINGVLKGEYPNNRYDLLVNPHLEKVFDGNEELLEKWKEPFDVELEQGERVPQVQQSPPIDIVRNLMKQAINNRHLGEDQELIYPSLVHAVECNDAIEIKKAIERLRKDINNTQARLLLSGFFDDQSSIEKDLRSMKIEFLCLTALDVDTEDPSRVENLNNLLEITPEGIEFRHDVRGMLNALKPSSPSTVKWVNLQTTESWEDCLLMGTEVDNSCQRIDGDPYHNKCLLAYILDGKNKLMIVRDSEGKIAARSVLRILWDTEKHSAVLFMERIYTRTADPALFGLITNGCVEKARQMGLPLVASKESYPAGSAYPGQIEAFGGPAPYEYVDALGRIQKNGEFTIPSSQIIYMPDTRRHMPDVGEALGIATKSEPETLPSLPRVRAFR